MEKVRCNRWKECKRCPHKHRLPHKPAPLWDGYVEVMSSTTCNQQKFFCSQRRKYARCVMVRGK